ncbi:MAG: histone deacetylase [Bryobacteraceae bacterium]|jgi:acetoin utilization deacetylase AcuC-like enzyme
MADPLFRRHLKGREHPERPERFDAVLEGLRAAGLLKRLATIPARPASDEELMLCHSREYLAVVRRDVAGGASYLSTGDTEVTRESERVAAAAVGGVLNAVDAVCAGELGNAFCAVRPPGHHASQSRGMGFCIYNNVALAARHAQRRHGLERVLILDWDVHHGNGTADIFYSDASVFFCSTHQWPLYPGTGRAEETGVGAGRGTTLNLPLPAGSGRREILGAVEGPLAREMKNFRPELVLISAGFDSREGDLLGRFTLTDDDFADLTAAAMAMADEYANGRLVSVLEGGYTLNGLASAAAAHVGRLAGEEFGSGDGQRPSGIGGKK